MSKGSGIDYSKWDHFHDSDDEDVEDVSHKPRVTNLGTPCRVSSANDGTIHIRPSADNKLIPVQESLLDGKANSDKTQYSGSGGLSSPSETIPVGWSRSGGIIKDYVMTNQMTTTVYWSQDRYIVQVRFLVILKPDLLPSKSIQVTWEGKIFKYADRFAAVGTSGSSTTARIQVCAKGIENKRDIILFEGTLPHPIHFHEDEDDELDWSIEYDSVGEGRYVVLTLPKATPMEGIFMKWNRPILEVDTRNESREQSEGQSAFQQAWDQAHHQFRENIRKGKLSSC
mmetsp:Transcript_30686/g.46478  ORF Transcript_30686/g.46478 Transcript_30686/m.46478 type:complete len:284 (-) Transcript_30686:92-943(-)